MIEVRWHARAGQGAKTASQLLAVAMLRAGKSVQAFPEYGPERSGAPLRAFTRVDERRIRRHDAVTTPEAVVVLDPSLVGEVEVLDGLGAEGLLIVNSLRRQEEVRAYTGHAGPLLCVPATLLAAEGGSRFVNVVMVGALAAALGEPPLEDLVEAAAEVLGAKADPSRVRAALESGFRSAGEALVCVA